MMFAFSILLHLLPQPIGVHRLRFVRVSRTSVIINTFPFQKGILVNYMQEGFNMRVSKILFIIAVTFLVYAPSLHAADLQGEIFGLRWGSRQSGMNSFFTKVWSSSNVDFYIKPGEVRTINDVVVPEVIYGFYKDQFFAVYIKIDSIEVFDDFRRYMKSKYGIPQKTMSLKKDQTIYHWKYEKIKIKLKIYGKDNYMKLAFYYTPLSSKVNEAQKEKFQTESFKFLPIEKDKRPTSMPLLVF